MCEVYIQTGFVFPPRVIRYQREDFTQEFRQSFLAYHDHICAYCGDTATAIDHFIPVSLGGTNHPLNLYPCCHRCNSTASAHLFETFTQKQRYIIQRRFEAGSLPLDYDPESANEYAHCVDCGALYRYGGDATIFLCPVCRYLDEHRPLPSWRMKRIASHLASAFKGRNILTP